MNIPKLIPTANITKHTLSGDACNLSTCDITADCSKCIFGVDNERHYREWKNGIEYKLDKLGL